MLRQILNKYQKNQILYGYRGQGKTLYLTIKFEKYLNKLRLKTYKKIEMFAIRYGRDLKEINFNYYYYTVILRFKKWYQRPFYTLKKHMNKYKGLDEEYKNECNRKIATN